MKTFREMFRDKIDPVDGTVIINERDFAAIQEDAQELVTASQANILLCFTGHALRLLRLILKRAIGHGRCPTSEELAEIQEVERLVIKPFLKQRNKKDKPKEQNE